MKTIFSLLMCLLLGSNAMAKSNQIALLDPVLEAQIHSSKVVLKFGAYNKAATSQRLTAEIKTLIPGDKIGFYTKDKIINKQKFNQFIIGNSMGKQLNFAANQHSFRISPRKVNVRPKQSRPFRVRIRFKSNKDNSLLPGTYFGNLLIKQLPLKNNIVTDTKEVDNKKIGININLLFNQYTAFYLNKGKGNPFNPAKGQQPAAIECTIDKENKNLTLHIHNNTSYALRAKAKSDAISDKTYSIVTVLPYTQAKRDIQIPIRKNLKLPLQLKLLAKNKELTRIKCT